MKIKIKSKNEKIVELIKLKKNENQIYYEQIFELNFYNEIKIHF